MPPAQRGLTKRSLSRFSSQAGGMVGRSEGSKWEPTCAVLSFCGVHPCAGYRPDIQTIPCPALAAKILRFRKALRDGSFSQVNLAVVVPKTDGASMFHAFAGKLVRVLGTRAPSYSVRRFPSFV